MSGNIVDIEKNEAGKPPRATISGYCFGGAH